MSITGHLAMIPSAAWPLGVGLLVNSSILFGNLGVGLAGAVPIARNQLGESNLKPKEKVRVWKLFYKAAAKYVVPGIITTTSLHLLAAYLTPRRRVRNLSLTAALVSLTIIPHTLYFIMPTNNLLLSLDSKTALNEIEERYVDKLLKKWNDRHSARFVQYVIAYTAGLGALMGVVGRW